MDRIRTISRILLILYVIAVGILCFSRFNTGIDLSSTWFGIPKDKVVHFTMFLPYPILMYAAFFRYEKRPARLILFLIIVIAAGMILAGATELIQGELKYRSADIMDFRADSLGIFTGSIITLIACILVGKKK